MQQPDFRISGSLTLGEHEQQGLSYLVSKQRRLEGINNALREGRLKNAIIIVCIFWSLWTVICTDLLAFFCVLCVLSKGSDNCTTACSCCLQQLNLLSLLSRRKLQGLASLQYLRGGCRWTGRQTNLSCSATSHSKLHISSFLSFMNITCVALHIHFLRDKCDQIIRVRNGYPPTSSSL